MSVRTDTVNLIVNVGGDKAKDELNQLRKKAADMPTEMKGPNIGLTASHPKSRSILPHSHFRTAFPPWQIELYLPSPAQRSS